MTLAQFAVQVYNHVLRRSYDLFIEATDPTDAQRRAEYVLGYPCLDQRTYVVRVRSL